MHVSPLTQLLVVLQAGPLPPGHAPIMQASPFPPFPPVLQQVIPCAHGMAPHTMGTWVEPASAIPPLLELLLLLLLDEPASPLELLLLDPPLELLLEVLPPELLPLELLLLAGPLLLPLEPLLDELPLDELLPLLELLLDELPPLELLAPGSTPMPTPPLLPWPALPVPFVGGDAVDPPPSHPLHAATREAPSDASKKNLPVLMQSSFGDPSSTARSQ
jgi:hypothetical protein